MRVKSSYHPSFAIDELRCGTFLSGLVSAMKTRTLIPELMDNPNLGEESHLEALQGLQRINRWTGNAIIAWRPICSLARSLGRDRLTVLSRSKVVHFDGPQSVRAAFTLPEIRSLATRAGLQDIELRTSWPCRFVLVGGNGR